MVDPEFNCRASPRDNHVLDQALAAIAIYLRYGQIGRVASTCHNIYSGDDFDVTSWGGTADSTFAD
jgi:hypothetical protein